MTEPRIAIITAVGGDTAILHDPPIVHPNVDYIAFVGFKQDVVVWKQHHLVKFSSLQPDAEKRNELLPRIVPQLFCANHDVYILVDPDHTVVIDPFELVEKYLNDSSLGLFAHRQHSCVREVILSIGNDEDAVQQWNSYNDMGFPGRFGFYDLSLMLMRNATEMLKMCLRWWEHVCRYSGTPELSLPYVLWTLGIKPSILPGYAPESGSSNGAMGVISMRYVKNEQQKVVHGL